MNWIKRILLAGIFATMLSVSASAQAHSVTLTFTRSVDDTSAAGQGYTTWRLASACPASVTSTTGFIAVNATLFTTTTYTDSTVVPGKYCYVITFTSGSASSVPSNTGAATILPAAPTNVTITGSN
jgi:hypothetical protein